MDHNKLRLMQQWETVIGVMGFDLDEIIEKAWNTDEEFMDTLVSYLAMEKRRVDQEPVLQAVLRTVEMGITETDIEEYYEHIEKIKEAEKAEQDKTTVLTNPCIQNLHNVHGFRFVDPPKRYNGHTCFTFTTRDGTVVHGRCFRPTWSMHRIWTTWKDRSGKTHKQKWEPEYSTYPPAAFPEPWHGRATTQVLCYMIAYSMTTPRVKMPASHLIKAGK